MIGHSPCCPVCRQAVVEDPVECERCTAPYHRDCWSFIGNCSIFGCGAQVVPVEPIPGDYPWSLWLLRSGIVMTVSPIPAMFFGPPFPVMATLLLAVTASLVALGFHATISRSITSGIPGEKWLKSRMILSWWLFAVSTPAWGALILFQIALGIFWFSRSGLPALSADRTPHFLTGPGKPN